MSTKSGTSSGRSSSENSLNQQAQVQPSSAHQQPSPAGSSSSSSAGVSEPVVAVATNATSTLVAAVASPTTSVSSSKSKSSSSSSSSNEPKARLCHLKKWPHFQGYGFNLHAERSRQGQHIGKVDPNSPAESAGLREGDRIIEVNYVNISNENHQQVVKRIRSGLEYDNVTHDDEVLLLVVDRQADEWFKSQGVIVRSSNPDQVIRLTTAGVNINSHDDNEDHSDDDENNDEHRLKGASNDHNNNIPGPVEIKTTGTNSPAASSSTASSPQVADAKRVHSVSGTPSPDTKNKLSSSSNSSMNGNAVVVSNVTAATATAAASQSSQSPRSHQQTVMPKSTAVVTPNLKVNTSSPASISHSQQPVSKPSPNNSKSSSSASSTLSTASSSVNRQGQSQDLANKTNGVPKDDVYKMSAAEFKNYLKSKGRNDPRGISIDMRRKYEIFQNM